MKTRFTEEQIIRVLKDLCESRGAAVMLVTHDMGVIAETASRMIVMNKGKIVESGSVGDRAAMNRTGKSDGLTLRKLGGVVISIGSRRCAMVSAVCTSSAAASMLRSRSN